MEDLWIVRMLAIFVISVLLTGFLIPQILLISFRKKLFDEPNERKIHTSLVPRLGGIAFMPAMFLSMALVCAFDTLLGFGAVSASIGANQLPVAFTFCAIMSLYLTGVADDLIGVRYRAKFVIQIICAMMLIAGGLWINDLHGFMGIDQIPWWIGYPFTILIVVFAINAINLIDGIDGLASGLSACAMIVYGFVAYSINEYVCSLLAFTTLGVLVPFFYFNVFGDAKKQHKIFMGDTGSLTIGIVICAIALRLLNTCNGDPDYTEFFGNMEMVALSPMLIPCLDVVRVYMGRVRRGQNPFLPDKTHIHHKLLAIGMNQRVAMVTIVATSIILSCLFIYLSAFVNITWIVIGGGVFYTVANIYLSKLISDGKKVFNCSVQVSK
jgi:UDP-N-acetylmuramyl pentapeptide phosphotransferase/UDP-N-acetylglucosamine-1-phosphate transferase